MRILIVDDDPAICEGTVFRLRRMRMEEPLETAVAYSGEEALEYLRSEGADILITDIRMKDMDGLELIRSALPLDPLLTCVIISAYDDFAYAQQAISLGVVDFLVKPCSESEMSRCVRNAAQKHAENVSAHRILSGLQREAGPAEEDERILAAKQYVLEHMSEPIDMAVVANRLNLSYAYFSRVFHDATNRSFSRYIVERRMEETCRRMRNGERLVDIAVAVGYQNANNLTRAFTREFGISPRTWLREQGISEEKGGNEL